MNSRLRSLDSVKLCPFSRENHNILRVGYLVRELSELGACLVLFLYNDRASDTHTHIHTHTHTQYMYVYTRRETGHVFYEHGNQYHKVF